MAKKNTSQRADPKRFHWSFSEELVNNTFFQQYVGAYGAYMRLVDTTNRRDLKEYYISKATIFIAKIKTRILSDGCFFGVYKGKDEALISDALSFSEYLEEATGGAYKRTILASMNDDVINYVNGSGKDKAPIDPNLNVAVYANIWDGYSTYLKKYLNGKHNEYKDAVYEDAINRLVEEGMSREDAKKIIDTMTKGKPVDDLIETAMNEKNDTLEESLNSDPVVEEVDVDEFLNELGLQ
jgi:hypothetical protein